MIQGNDVLVLVHLARASGPWTFRSLGGVLGVDIAALHRSIRRLQIAHLLDDDRQVDKRNLEEFLLHALRFIVPAELGPVARGRPTAWGAAPLREIFAEPSEPAPVWPDPKGASRGPRIEPVAEGVLSLAASDPELAEWFALLDAIRVGRARERTFAADELRTRIWADASPS